MDLLAVMGTAGEKVRFLSYLGEKRPSYLFVRRAITRNCGDDVRRVHQDWNGRSKDFRSFIRIPFGQPYIVQHNKRYRLVVGQQFDLWSKKHTTQYNTTEFTLN